jgi:hypothetical protein
MIGYVIVVSNGLDRATTCYDLNKRLLRVIPKIRQRNKLKTNSGNNAGNSLDREHPS